MHNDHPIRAQKLLATLPKHLKLFKAIEKMALANIESNYQLWSSYIFVPIGVWASTLKSTIGSIYNDEARCYRAAEDMMAIGAFRYTKDIYTFDKTLIESLIKTPIDNINATALKRLPDPCLYIDVKGQIKIDSRVIDGFYVYYDDEVAGNRLANKLSINDDSIKNVCTKDDQFLKDVPEKLGIRILWQDDELNNISVCALPLVDGDILEALTKIATIRRTLFEENRDYIHQTSSAEAFNKLSYNYNLSQELEVIESKNILSTLLPLILYLCTTEPDIKDKKNDKLVHKGYFKRDKGKKIFSPSNFRTWVVGENIGKSIRENISTSKTWKVSPHLRRAHWHGYYKGPRADKDRKLVYKWLPPIYVQGSKELKEYDTDS